MLLNAFQASFTTVSQLQVMVCHSLVSGMFKYMSWKEVRVIALAFSTTEIVYLIECIVMASLSFTRCNMSCGACGGCDKSNFFNMIVIVWCIHFHMTLDYGLLLIMGTSLIPKNRGGRQRHVPYNCCHYCGQLVPLVGFDNVMILP